LIDPKDEDIIEGSGSDARSSTGEAGEKLQGVAKRWRQSFQGIARSSSIVCTATAIRQIMHLSICLIVHWYQPSTSLRPTLHPHLGSRRTELDQPIYTGSEDAIKAQKRQVQEIATPRFDAKERSPSVEKR